MGEEKKGSGKLIGRRLLVVLLILILILGPVVTAKTQIRFSAENYTGQEEAYAAQIMEQETPYLSDDRMSRQWKYLQTVGRVPREYEDFKLFADIAIANGDLESAANYLKDGIAAATGKEADLGVAYLRLGGIYVLLGDRENAENMLDEAVAKNEELAPAWFLRAQLAAEEENTEKAIESFHSYIRLPGKDPKEALALGEMFESLEDYESAVICYTAGIEEESLTTAALYADRARCEILLEDTAAARKDLETYFTQTEEDPEGRPAAMLGMCLMEDEEFKEAVTWFHRALEDGYPETAVLYSQAAKSAFAAEDYKTAQEDGLKALSELKESGGDTAETAFWTGLAYLAQEQYKEAAGYLEETKAGNADYPDIEYYLGVCALAQEEYTAAREHFTASIEREEQVTASYYNRAVCYLNEEDYSKAKADLQQVTDRDDEELTEKAEEVLEAIHNLTKQR